MSRMMRMDEAADIRDECLADDLPRRCGRCCPEGRVVRVAQRDEDVVDRIHCSHPTGRNQIKLIIGGGPVTTYP